MFVNIYQVYWAVEDTDCCTRNCCGPARPFDMKILDIYKNQVIHLNRPLACSSCFFPCCLQVVHFYTFFNSEFVFVYKMTMSFVYIYMILWVKNLLNRCLKSIAVSAPPGNPIGKIEQEWSICSPAFSIKNHNDETVLRIEGPFCTFSICGDVDFRVRNENNTVFFRTFEYFFLPPYRFSL